MATRGRKKIYENAAAREKSYREKFARPDILVPLETDQTLREICELHEVSKNALINAMVKFALTNHDWKREMLWGLTK